MTVYFFDTNECRCWQNSEAKELVKEEILNITSKDSILIHGTDWRRWHKSKPPSEDMLLGALCYKGFGANNDISNCEIVFFSGDLYELNKNRVEIEKQLVSFGHRGSIFFVPYSVDDADTIFGGYIKEKSRNESLLAKDYLTHERESLEVAFKLLLQGYLLGTLPDKLIPNKLKDISINIQTHRKNKDLFNFQYWEPVCSSSGCIDSRLESFLTNEELAFLALHNFCKDKMPHDTTSEREFALWLKKTTLSNNSNRF